MSERITQIERGMSESVVLAIYAARISQRLNSKGQLVDVLEEDFTTATIELAEWYGWMVMHQLPALTRKGYRTQTQGHGKGFPDLIANRPKTRHKFVAELKCNKNKVTDEQAAWLNAFEICGTPAFTWYPRDIEEIKDVLKHGAEWPAGFRRKRVEVPATLI